MTDDAASLDKLRPREPLAQDFIIGGQIKALRKAKGLSQLELGDALGISLQMVSKYERSESRVSPSRLQDIARFFGVTVASMFGEQDAGGGDHELRRLLRAKGAIDLMIAYDAIESEDRRAAVLAIVHTAARIDWRASMAGTAVKADGAEPGIELPAMAEKRSEPRRPSPWRMRVRAPRPAKLADRKR